MTSATAFNRSAFGTWINSPPGRVFRIMAGSVFLLIGLRRRSTAAGKASIIWGLLPLSAGVGDLCYVSAALGGPIRGDECRHSARIR
ncbi:hypothetical protein AB0333_03820 [Citricoccus sp. NPDC079358]|jgi:hypothetical protein|uniref:hypothetical protein n=1 Tax=Citricoccus sp. NPDC079358 TaxID=3154653 RepID=UPI00344E2768